MSSKKVIINNNAKGSTSQAGLVTEVKFLRKCGIIESINEKIEHERGANVLYDSVDSLFLTIVSTIGGARALSDVATVWADSVLRRLVGCVAIPDNSTGNQ